MNHCPKCGKQLPLQNLKFCPECGYNLSVPSAKDYDIICPDCNSVIAEESSDCPICGCPSDLFIKRAKTKSAHGEKLECPDCGKVFAEIIPLDCPNCGCPSDNFEKYEEQKVPQVSYMQRTVLITIIIGVIGCLGHFIYSSKAQEAAEQARQEQYQKEQQAQRERDEREAKEKIERENKEALNKFVGTYSSGPISGGYQSGYGRFVITFYKDKTFSLRFIDAFTGNILDSQKGTYTFYYEMGGQLLDNRGKIINYYTINSLGYSISIGDYDLTKR